MSGSEGFGGIAFARCSHVTALRLYRGDVTEVPARFTPGFVSRNALLDELAGAHLEVESDLVAECLVADRADCR